MMLEELSHSRKWGGRQRNLAKMGKTWGFALNSLSLLWLSPCSSPWGGCMSLAKHRPALQPSVLMLDASKEGAAVNDPLLGSLDLRVGGVQRSVLSYGLGQQWNRVLATALSPL